MNTPTKLMKNILPSNPIPQVVDEVALLYMQRYAAPHTTRDWRQQPAFRIGGHSQPDSSSFASDALILLKRLDYAIPTQAEDAIKLQLEAMAHITDHPGLLATMQDVALLSKFTDSQLSPPPGTPAPSRSQVQAALVMRAAELAGGLGIPHHHPELEEIGLRRAAGQLASLTVVSQTPSASR